MKNILIIVIGLSVMSACNNVNNDSSGSGKKKENKFRITENNKYRIESAACKADWERVLDQKPTHQKVKLLGQMVDVELGEIKMNSNGKAVITDGELTTSNDSIIEATVIFDMASFKLSKEKGNGLFDVKNYPNSKLEMENFLKDSSGFRAKGKLTIQEKSNPVDIKLEIIKQGKIQLLKGKFLFNTLDFPLRDNVTKKDVKKDEIKIKFDLKYNLKSSKQDTIYFQ